MRKLIIIASLFSFSTSFAQLITNKPETQAQMLDSNGNVVPPKLEIITSGLSQYKNIIYQRITQQYITNENQFFLDVKLDTTYIIIKKSPKIKDVYSIGFFGDDKGKKSAKNITSVEKKEWLIKFNAQGEIDSLYNWKEFRDMFVSALSVQARENLINSSLFAERKTQFNNHDEVAKLVLGDIHYLFLPYGDTFDLNVKYLRLKQVKDPFTQEDLEILGDYYAEYKEGSSNTVNILAHNQAGPDQKPSLLQECQEYLRSRNNTNEPTSEVTSVGLNSEQEYRYNKLKKAFMWVTFSDVITINLQSRGNLRTYRLWDAN